MLPVTLLMGFLERPPDLREILQEAKDLKRKDPVDGLVRNMGNLQVMVE